MVSPLWPFTFARYVLRVCIARDFLHSHAVTHLRVFPLEWCLEGALAKVFTGRQAPMTRQSGAGNVGGNHMLVEIS